MMAGSIFKMMLVKERLEARLKIIENIVRQVDAIVLAGLKEDPDFIEMEKIHELLKDFVEDHDAFRDRIDSVPPVDAIQYIFDRLVDEEIDDSTVVANLRIVAEYLDKQRTVEHYLPSDAKVIAKIGTPGNGSILYIKDEYPGPKAQPSDQAHAFPDGKKHYPSEMLAERDINYDDDDDPSKEDRDKLLTTMNKQNPKPCGSCNNPHIEPDYCTECLKNGRIYWSNMNQDPKPTYRGRYRK